MISSTAVQQMICAYGLSYADALPHQKGYRNHSIPVRLADGHIVNLILYKQEQDTPQLIDRANRISNYLAAQGFPARHSVDERILRIGTPYGDRYVALYNYLSGSTIAWEAYTQKHIKLLGASMGTMHKLLSSRTADNLPMIQDICLRQLQAMDEYFASAGVATAMARKLGVCVTGNALNRMHKIIASSSHWGAAQPLHMDFVRGNVLFQNNADGTLQVSGVIDFEKAAYGPVVFDIARTLAFLLVDCKYKQEDKVRKYFLQSGYQKRGGALLDAPIITLAGQKYHTLESLLDYFLLHDLYKFLHHNPYESLLDNHHYVRTRDFLLERHVIQPTGE